MLARVIAFDVEPMRIGEDVRVAVDACEVEDDQFAAPHQGARDLGVLARDPRTHLHRRIQPQDLLDGAGPQFGRSASVARCSGELSSIRIPLPSRFTVVSNPAASTRPAVACSSASFSGPPRPRWPGSTGSSGRRRGCAAAAEGVRQARH